MTNYLTLENCEAVVMYNNDNIPFSWTTVDRKTKNFIVANEVNFSLKTGKISKEQNKNTKIHWTPVQFLQRGRNVVTIPYSDIAVRVEPFDVNDLEEIEVSKDALDLGIFENETTISEFIDSLKLKMEERGIPQDAVITHGDDVTIWLNYKRKETLEERTERLYRKPETEAMKNKRELERLEADLHQKTHELEQIKAKIEKNQTAG